MIIKKQTNLCVCAGAGIVILLGLNCCSSEHKARAYLIHLEFVGGNFVCIRYLWNKELYLSKGVGIWPCVSNPNVSSPFGFKCDWQYK